MASHLSSRRWLLREFRLAYVPLVLVAVVAAILTYFIDWSTVRRKSVVRPTNDNIEQRYTGSIIIPTSDGLCWRSILDNRTGSLRDGGYSKCDDATLQFDERSSPEETRLHEVSKAFRHEGN